MIRVYWYRRRRGGGNMITPISIGRVDRVEEK